MFCIRPLLLLSLVVSTASCTAESSTAPFVSPSLSSSYVTGSPQARPAGGTCAVTAVAVAPFPFSPPLFEPFINLEIEGVCNLKHMGRTTLASTEKINLITGVVVNTGTWTAANGDQIFSEFSGTGITDGINATFGGVITYVGGTGRFQGVTGSLDAEGNSNASTNPATGEYRMNGTITY